jgi:hypothetical protein
VGIRLSSRVERRGVKALDAQGRHHGGFDVARGRSGISHHQKLDVERHPGKAQATHRKMRPKDRPLANDFIPDTEVEACDNGTDLTVPTGSAVTPDGNTVCEAGSSSTPQRRRAPRRPAAPRPMMTRGRVQPAWRRGARRRLSSQVSRARSAAAR